MLDYIFGVVGHVAHAVSKALRVPCTVKWHGFMRRITIAKAGGTIFRCAI
ncbi:hypothetical protein [Sphingomonas sp. LM7]|nr:hypothetical protein [Sphingomonas sp. LM7]